MSYLDLRKGSQVPPGKRVCFRCRGKKKMYKIGGAWTSEIMSSAEPQSCPLCLGDGYIDKIVTEDVALGCEIADLKEKENGKKGKGRSKPKRQEGKGKFEKDF